MGEAGMMQEHGIADAEDDGWTDVYVALPADEATPDADSSPRSEALQLEVLDLLQEVHSLRNENTHLRAELTCMVAMQRCSELENVELKSSISEDDAKRRNWTPGWTHRIATVLLQASAGSCFAV